MLPEDISYLSDGMNLPIYAGIELVNRCNVNCKMCFFSQAYEHGIYKWPKYRSVTLDDFKVIVGDLPIRGISFEGAYSEPFMSKHILEILEFVKKRSGTVAVVTNGTLLLKRTVDRLVDMNADILTISLHGGNKDTAESVMRQVDFGKIVENLEYLKKRKAEKKSDKPRINFMFVAMKSNISSLPDYIKLAKKLAVKEVYIKSMNVPSGQLRKDIDSTTDWDDEDILKHPELIEKYYSIAKETAKTEGVSVVFPPAFETVTSR